MRGFVGEDVPLVCIESEALDDAHHEYSEIPEYPKILLVRKDRQQPASTKNVRVKILELRLRFRKAGRVWWRARDTRATCHNRANC